MITSETGENFKGNLTSWSVSNSDSMQIEINLEFDKALHVSQGEVRDKLLVLLNFDGFTDTYGVHLPPGLQKIRDLPPQITKLEAKTV